MGIERGQLSNKKINRGGNIMLPTIIKQKTIMFLSMIKSGEDIKIKNVKKGEE